MTDDQLDREIEIWKTTIEVQQHFNDLQMKVRNYALTLLLAVLGAAGLAIREGTILRVFGRNVSLATGLLIVGLFAWLAFYFMDRGWYHRLLKGAVDHAKSIESRLKDEVPGLGLSTAIGDASPIKIPLWKQKVHSTGKLDLFYGVVAGLLVGIAIVVELAAPEDRRDATISCRSSGTVATCETRDGSIHCEASDGKISCSGDTD